MSKKTIIAALASGALALSAAPGFAQAGAGGANVDELMRDLRILLQQGQRTIAFAGMPTGSLTAPGTATVGLSGSYGPRRGVPGSATSTRFDASTSLAFGFGDPVNAVGVELGIVNLSFRNFGHSGYFQLGLNRQFSTGESVVSTALRVTDIRGWGDARNNKIGGTLVTSIAYNMQTASGPMPAMAIIGAGHRITTKKRAGAILGFGVGVSDSWSVNAGIYGDSALIGASYTPPEWSGLSAAFSLRKPRSQGATFGVDLGYNFRLFGG